MMVMRGTDLIDPGVTPSVTLFITRSLLPLTLVTPPAPLTPNNRRVVESAAKPGVTRMLKWVRLGGELDLLDAPGVIPAAFDDQVRSRSRSTSDIVCISDP